MTFAGEERADRRRIEAARFTQRAEHLRTRIFILHHVDRRSALSERVENKIGDRGAIFRAREAVRQTPFFEDVGDGTSTRGKIAKDFDGGGDMGGGGHLE